MDRIYDVTKKRTFKGGLRMSVILASMLFLTVISIIGTYGILLQRTREMGVELIKSYVADEERNISKYKTVIGMGLRYIEKLENDHDEFSVAEKNVMHFLWNAAVSLDNPELGCYVIYDGKLMSLQNIVGIENFDFTGTDLYKKIIDNDGDIVFAETPLYYDKEKKVNIAAQADPESGNAIFIDIQKADFERTHEDLAIPQESAYYLFNEEGSLMYYKVPFDVDEDRLEAYADELYKKVIDDNISYMGENITDINNEGRMFFYQGISNGWTCVMTIPHSELFSGFWWIIILYIVIFVLFFIVMIIISVRDMRMEHIIMRANATIRAIGNAYFAIYRVNLKEETYEMVKGSQEVKRMIPRSGKYNDMLFAFAHVVDDDTGVKITKTFSLEHVRQLVSENVTDFGGDFLRYMNGKKQWVNIALVLDDSLEKEEAVIVFRQVDNEKNQQIRRMKLLEFALAAADESEKSQKRFFSKISHEMRTPLNIILGMNELAMSEDCTSEKRLDYQRKIEYAGNDMLKLVNNILEISRMDVESMPVEKKAFNLSEEFSNIIQPFKEQAEREGKKLEVKTDIMTEDVLGDVLNLMQILNNLISNAFQFTHEGDNVTVTMRQAGVDSTNYIFTVEDTGIGIAEEDIPKIFVPYYRGGQFRDRSVFGGGLGLAVVKSLVSQKGGTIEVNSRLGEGTSFIVTLPFSPANVGETEEADSAPPDIMDGMSVLVVDDNELNRELIEELLSARGVRTVSAADGKEALDIFRESELFSFDAVIMDMQMPVMDGCESAAAIRALDRPDAKWVLIIALTANYFSEDVIRTAQAGMNAHLSKPVDMNILQKTLEDLISKRSSGNI